MRSRRVPESAFAGMEGTRPYEGAAWHYAEYRPRLSGAFVQLLVDQLGWSSDDRVLDLGAGPGQIARRLAPHVGEVVAVDPEPDMLAEGRRRASSEGLGNVRFVEGAAESVAGLDGPFRAVTIGSAFHWMRDQDAVLRDLDALVDRDGAVLIVGFDIDSPLVSVTGRDDRPWTEREPWALVRQILDRHVADVPARPHPRGRHDPFPDIFARSAFSRLELLRYEYDAIETPSVDAVLGAHYSNSHVLGRLGGRRAAFEAEVRALLAAAPVDPVTVRRTDSALVASRRQP